LDTMVLAIQPLKNLAEGFIPRLTEMLAVTVLDLGVNHPYIM